MLPLRVEGALILLDKEVLGKICKLYYNLAGHCILKYKITGAGCHS
jgi:hypothetical protein